MVRTPHTSHALVQTLHWPRDALQFLPARVSQQHDLLHNLIDFHVPDTHGFGPVVDIGSDHDGVFGRSGRDGDLDLRILFGEL